MSGRYVDSPITEDLVMSETHLNCPSPSQLIDELRKGLLNATPPVRAEAQTRIGFLLERLKAQSIVQDQAMVASVLLHNEARVRDTSESLQ